MKKFKSKTVPFLMTASVASVMGFTAEAQEKSPNFLFICVDDLRPQIGAYGHDYMVTPNLDQLASEGRLFTQQYVQVPTSGASRRCMLTGQYPGIQRYVQNETYGLDLVGTTEGEIPETFIHHLKRNGYYTVGMGKISHHGNGHVVYKGSESLELPNTWNRFVNDPDWLWKREDILHAYADGGGKSVKKGPAFEACDVPDESYPDGRLAKLAMSELELMAKKGDPFFMAVGFYKPHLPFSAPLKYWNMYKDEDVEMSQDKDVPKGVPGVFMHNSGEFFLQYNHPEKGGAGIILSEDYARDVTHGYYAALSYTDTQIGKVLDKLEELGLDDNTIIIVWGDHGWHLGDKTLWGKHSTFNRALNSAFMVKTPNMKHAGEHTDAIAATVDIYPTVCQLAGITPPEGIDGVSIVPVLEDPKASVRDEVYSFWNNMITVKTERYRMSLYNKGDENAVMLFDHKKDANETVNVAEKNPKVVKELTEKIYNINNGFLPDLQSK